MAESEVLNSFIDPRSKGDFLSDLYFMVGLFCCGLTPININKSPMRR